MYSKEEKEAIVENFSDWTTEEIRSLKRENTKEQNELHEKMRQIKREMAALGSIGSAIEWELQRRWRQSKKLK